MYAIRSYYAASQFGPEKNGRARGLNFACAQSPQRPRRGFDTNGLGAVQVGGIASRTVVVVPLHVAIRFAEDRAADRVAGLGVAADETVRIAVSPFV